ncbi:uncharacterized protein A4U43_C05F6490 [Asparagus officinalis]|uniref:beta-galactosidase n=1 Tax=Asparagus officinalis TaxID=4686 RepID=A0A5P1EQU8_ASPOF|nr:uncharacterized protein A4U43_C05F6490 [Asparagus officinalis]
MNFFMREKIESVTDILKEILNPIVSEAEEVSWPPRDPEALILMEKINTCNGFYCDSFKPNNETSPKMWTENWTGCFKSWDSPDPHRPAEDVALVVARFFQRGGIVRNIVRWSIQNLL